MRGHRLRAVSPVVDGHSAMMQVAGATPWADQLRGDAEILRQPDGMAACAHPSQPPRLRARPIGRYIIDMHGFLRSQLLLDRDNWKVAEGSEVIRPYPRAHA
jgi:hypothetical protein